MKNYELINKLKKKFSKKQNIQLFLQKNNFKRSETIELAYDIQSGSYIKGFKNFSKKDLEIKFYYFLKTIKEKFPDAKTILDFGTGEMTNLSYFMNVLPKNIKFFANDLSLNRLYLGRKFIKKKISKKSFSNLEIFCSNYSRLPFPDNSIDLIITCHSLEPNNVHKNKILNELTRVARLGMVMQEPHYEIANNFIKKRYDKFGYIKNIQRYFKNKKINLNIIPNVHNSKKKASSVFYFRKNSNMKKKIKYIDIDTYDKLLKGDSFYYSIKSSRVYPIINQIPVFKENNLYLPTFKINK